MVFNSGLRGNKNMSKNKSALLGAAFLMATSAVGPGFLTQTTVFTEKLATSFGFIILLSILIDLAVQFNIWQIITVSGKRAQDLANELFPGLGYLLVPDHILDAPYDGAEDTWFERFFGYGLI